MKNEYKTAIGTISVNGKGAGYVDQNDKKIDSIYVEPGKLNTAFHGDTVEVSWQTAKVRGRTEKVGEVKKIVTRARTHFVGAIKNENGKCLAAPDDRKAYVPFEISLADKNKFGLSDGVKVQVRFVSWEDSILYPLAEVIRVLGKQGENDVEMESIVLEHGFEVTFPKAVEQEAKELARGGKNIASDELAKRRDMRGTLTFTIDPFDAKDFDDAISFKVLTENEKAVKKISGQKSVYEIGVHIADVSHFVREGSVLDAEALKRGCSVYLVDRTIPMLPEALSNDVCSLNPGADKFAFSAIFIMDEAGQVYERWFGKTVINSDHRFTYETAQAVIDGVPDNTVKYSSNTQIAASADAGMKYREDLIILDNIAKKLQKEKFSKGAIEFEQEEIKFRLDKDGKPIGVYVVERVDTHKLIEEYMLLANREVAKFIFDSIKKKGGKMPSIYRVHDVPDKEKILNLATFVKALGYTLKTKDGTVSATDLNTLLDEIEDSPHESVIRIAAIRSMQKAIYSTKNIGHFGLAFNFYTHFTSPIRRYPDLIVHRVLATHLENEPFKETDIGRFQKIAERSTDREIDAADAERGSRKLKQVEYMSTRIGLTFKGTISGVTKWGIYVEENESKSEGMIHIRNLGDEYFNFNEKIYSIVGEKTGKSFSLGDEVSFKVIAADVNKRILDYQLV